jgi:hypothetical protein
VPFGLGANELGPLRLRLFWVGEAGGGAVAAAEVVVAVVVVVVVVVGLLVALLPQAAVSPPIAMSDRAGKTSYVTSETARGHDFVLSTSQCGRSAGWMKSKNGRNRSSWLV